MDKTESKRTNQSQGGLDIQVKANIEKSRGGRIWIRDDGAICIENECIVIQSRKDGQLDFTVDPDKCSCEDNLVGNELYQGVLKSALTGKGTNVTVKPKND